jgi:type VI secretion system secreted protein VgrG
MPESRHVLKTPLSTQPLVSRMKTFDALSQPFRYELEVVTKDTDIDRASLLGETVTLTLERDDHTRHFHGYVVEFSKRQYHLGTAQDRPVYTLVLRPWLWLLSLRKRCRIFHKSTAVDIVKEVFKDHGFTDKLETALSGSYRSYEYCVQYNETDLDFVNRLLEREGIYYYFKHSEDDHKLVLVDGPEHHELQAHNTDVPSRPVEGNLNNHIESWTDSNRLRSPSYTLDDYDFLVPTSDIKVGLDTDQPHTYEIGTQFEYPGGYTEADDGDSYVKARLHAQNAPSAYVNGISSWPGLEVGSAFTTAAAPSEHLILRSEMELYFADFERGVALPELQPLETTTFEIKNDFTAMLKSVPFRPERRTPKPVIAGLQTAMVVSTDPGAAEGTIHNDEHGRVMVRFLWADKSDDTQRRSCWIRVAQAWAGNSWGMQFIPRVGSEVIVSFQDGDPDRPLLVGSVYNGLWRSPFAQAEGTIDGAISGLRTDRGVKGPSEEEPNVLKFDDAKGKILMKSEEVGVKATKNANIEGDTVGLAGGLGGQSKIDVGGMMQTISLSCPFTLTLQTPMAQIELGPRGVVILGNLTVNNAIYPLPPTPVQIAAAVTELGVDFAKNAAMDAALGGGVDDDEPSPGEVKVPEVPGIEDEGLGDMA